MLQGTVNVLLYTVKTNKIHKFQNKFKNLRFESKQKPKQIWKVDSLNITQ